MSLMIHSPQAPDPQQPINMDQIDEMGDIDVAQPLLPPRDRLVSAKASPSFMSRCARFKQACFRFLGWIYKAFYKNCPSFEDACKQGNLWLVRGYAFMSGFSAETLRSALAAAATAAQWTVCQYFAQCIGLFTVDEQSKETALHQLIKNGSEEAALNLIGALPKGMLEPFVPSLLALSTSLGFEDISQALVKKSPHAAHHLLEMLIGDPQATSAQIERLLKAGITPGENSVACAILSGRDELLPILKRYGADLEHPNRTGVQPIHLAALHGSVNALAFLLDQGISVNTREHKHGYTSLYIALLAGQPAAAASLLTRGASNEFMLDGMTPLLLAYAKGHSSICHTLIATGQNLDARDATGMSAFDYACAQKDLQGLDLLARQEIDISSFIDSIDDAEAPGLVAQAYNLGCDPLAAAFIRAGKGLHAAGEHGISLATMAARDNRVLIQEALKTQQVEIPLAPIYADMTFEGAIADGYVAMAMVVANQKGVSEEQLRALDTKIFERLVGNQPINPVLAQQLLKVALEKHSSAAVLSLIGTDGVDPAEIPIRALAFMDNKAFHAFVQKAMELPSFNAQRYLNESIRRGDLGLFEILIQTADLLTEDDQGKTAFHCAAQYDPTGKMLSDLVVKHTEDHHGDVSFLFQTDKNGNTSLHFAAFVGSIVNVTILLNTLQRHLRKIKGGMAQMQGYINSPNLKLNSPLHLATAKKHKKVCELLIQCGANRAQKNGEGRSPEEADSSLKTIRSFAWEAVQEFFRIG